MLAYQSKMALVQNVLHLLDLLTALYATGAKGSDKVSPFMFVTCFPLDVPSRYSLGFSVQFPPSFSKLSLALPTAFFLQVSNGLLFLE